MSPTERRKETRALLRQLAAVDVAYGAYVLWLPDASVRGSAVWTSVLSLLPGDNRHSQLVLGVLFIAAGVLTAGAFARRRWLSLAGFLGLTLGAFGWGMSVGSWTYAAIVVSHGIGLGFAILALWVTWQHARPLLRRW